MIYVTSDLHGYPVEKFKEFLTKSGFTDLDTLYILGDVIDRGEHGVDILKWVMSQENIHMILGNHEHMMLMCKFYFDKIVFGNGSSLDFSPNDITFLSRWERNGSEPTIRSLSNLTKAEVDIIYDFIDSLPLYKEIEVNNKNFLLVHGGLDNFDKNKDLEEYTTHDIVWHRPTLEQKFFDDKFVVLGHTPTIYYGEQFKDRAIKTDTWIDIDTGVAYGLNPMILRLDDMKEFYIDK